MCRAGLGEGLRSSDPIASRRGKGCWSEVEVERCELEKHHRKMENLCLKVQFLANDSEKVPRLQTQMTAKDVELTARRVAECGQLTC